MHVKQNDKIVRGIFAIFQSENSAGEDVITLRQGRSRILGKICNYTQILLTGVFSAIMAILPDNTQLPLAIVVICLGLLSGVVLWEQMKKKE